MRIERVFSTIALICALAACSEQNVGSSDDIFADGPVQSSPSIQGPPERKISPTPGVVLPLPDSAYHVGWLGTNIPSALVKGQIFTAEVRVRNDGNVAWPDIKTSRGTPSGAGAVRLGYRWWGKDEPPPAPMSGYADVRGELERPLAPGETAKIMLPVRAPDRVGKYMLQIDLVHELVSWFEVKGTRPLTLTVEVK